MVGFGKARLGAGAGGKPVWRWRALGALRAREDAVPAAGMPKNCGAWGLKHWDEGVPKNHDAGAQNDCFPGCRRNIAPD